MNPILKCFYCGTGIALGDGHRCTEADRVMHEKRLAETFGASSSVSSRNARRLRRKAERKVTRKAVAA